MHPQILSTRIETRRIETLLPYARNARRHPPAQIQQIANSIVEFGFTLPLLIDGHNGVIAGHARLLAARQLQLCEVPVIVLDHLTDTQKRAYLLADNQLALNAGWDEELLSQELAALEQELFKLDLIGFSPAELDSLLAAATPRTGRIAEDEVPSGPATVVTASGDLWVLAQHRVLCGDATHPDSFERLMQAGQAEMTFTDPPYNVHYAQTAGKRSGPQRVRRIANDNLGEGFAAFLYTACSNLLQATRGAIYICMSSSELHTLHQAFVSAGGHWSTFLIWGKDHFTLGRSDYQRQYEPILYGWKAGQDHFWCGARNQGDIWYCDKPRRNDLHPTMKPVALIERALENSSRNGDLVLDPFGGSGSTLIACEKRQRQGRLMELEPRYVDVMVQRWQQFTGQAAVLEGAGCSFEEAARQRLLQAA